MHTKTMNQTSNMQKDIFWATLVAFFVLVSLYIGFLSVSISNVAVRQGVNDKIVSLRSKVAQLEFQYVALQNTITSDTALSKGFVAQAPVAYVTKESRLSFARP